MYAVMQQVNDEIDNAGEGQFIVEFYFQVVKIECLFSWLNWRTGTVRHVNTYWWCL